MQQKKETDLILRATREGFAEGLIEAGQADERVYAVCADLAVSVGMQKFSEQFPQRFVEVGVAEQNLVTVASGLCLAGKIPFASSFAMFSPGRNWEQIRTTICYNNQPVIIVGSHAGLGVGEDGATHQALEDIALMRILPNMQVIVPCDANQAKLATIAAAKSPSPAYIRTFRQKSPVITSESDVFAIGKIQALKGEKLKTVDVCIIGAGPILSNALDASEMLSKAGITSAVLNCHTIKPLDDDAIISFASKAKLVAVVEDHQIAGGLGSAIAEFLSGAMPKKIVFIGINDSFGESASAEELYRKYHLDSAGISAQIKCALGKNIPAKKSSAKRKKIMQRIKVSPRILANTKKVRPSKKRTK